MKRLLLSLCMFTVLLACDREMPKQTPTFILNDKVAEAVTAYQSRYVMSRSGITFENGITATTCADYLIASQASQLKEDVSNQLIKSEYLECDVLSLLGPAKFAQEKEKLSAGSELANRLDLRSFPSSLFRRLDENNNILNKVGKDHLTVGPTHVAYDTDDWFYRLEVVATADINKNNQADWIIWLIDEAKTGNYRGYQTLIIYDVERAGQKLKASLYPQANENSAL